MSRPISRRDFLASSLATLGAFAAGPGIVTRVLGAPTVTDGPYGPLRAADANGVMLPRGFTSRIIARSGSRVAGASYVWHDAPDGGATFVAPDGGWIYVSNSETNAPRGGAGAVHFGSDGRIVDAYRILDRTARNCAGGPTPWGTWLSCEEHDRGRVWECDPRGERAAAVRPALGVFQHESAAVDPIAKRVYLTEDQPDGRFYRFTPEGYPSLEAGLLEVADVSPNGRTQWRTVPDPLAKDVPTRRQVVQSTRFAGGEGTWYDAGVVYFTTKGDNRVWAYDTRGERLSVLYDESKMRGAPLTGVDNVTVSRAGDVLVAEDGGNLEIVMITPDEEVVRLLRVVGGAHSGSEITGPAFDPSGKRLYFSSQRGYGRGVTFEVRGPFRTKRTLVPPPSPTVRDVRPAAAAPPSTEPLPLARDERGPPAWTLAAGAAAGAGVLGAAGLNYRRRRRGATPPDA